MLKTLVFVALFLLCTAQTPTRPELSESFQAKVRLYNCNLIYFDLFSLLRLMLLLLRQIQLTATLLLGKISLIILSIYYYNSLGFWTRSMDESSQVEEIEFVVKAGGQSIPYNTYIVQRYDLNPPKIFEVDQ